MKLHFVDGHIGNLMESHVSNLLPRSFVGPSSLSEQHVLVLVDSGRAVNVARKKHGLTMGDSRDHKQATWYSYLKFLKVDQHGFSYLTTSVAETPNGIAC